MRLPTRHHLSRLLAAAALGCALAAAIPAAAAANTGLPAPDQYNTTPTCPVTVQAPNCGWTSPFPLDASNPYAREMPKGPGLAFSQICAFWVWERRPDLTFNVTSAGVQSNAVADGASVTTGVPAVADAAVWGPSMTGPDGVELSGSGGHVAYVEAVNADGSIVISEMGNFEYPNGDTSLVSAEDVAITQFIGLPTEPWSYPATGTNPSPPPTPAPTPSPTPTPAPALTLMSAHISPVVRDGRRVTLTAHLTHGTGTVTAVAQLLVAYGVDLEPGSTAGRVVLRAKHATSSRFALSGQLTVPGRWTILITFHAGPGSRAPRTAARSVTIPRSAR